MTDTPPETPSPVSKAGWKKHTVHEGVILPSGAVVSIKLPNLPQLIKAGSIPNPLIDAAITFSREQPEMSRETLEREADFVAWLIPEMVVKPEVTEADVPELPPEDLQLLAAFAARITDEDAVGNQLGGLHTNQTWRRFRGRTSLDEIAADLHLGEEGSP